MSFLYCLFSLYCEHITLYFLTELGLQISQFFLQYGEAGHDDGTGFEGTTRLYVEEEFIGLSQCIKWCFSCVWKQEDMWLTEQSMYILVLKQITLFISISIYAFSVFFINQYCIIFSQK